MSQDIFSDILPASTSGTQLATLLNSFKDAVASGFSGDTARPANLQANGHWVKFNDPDDGILTFYIYDGTQDIEVFQLNKTTASLILSDTTDEFSIVKTSDDTLGPALKLQKARIAGGSQTVDGDILGNVEFIGQDGSAVEYTQAKIRAITTDDVTAATRGSEIAFFVTADSGSALLEAIRITNDRKLGVGTETPAATIEAVGSDSTAGVKATVKIESTVGPEIIAHKERINVNGQVASGDTLGTFKATSTDEAGGEIDGAAIKAEAIEQHSTTQGGTSLVIQRVKAGETALTDIVTLDESGMTVSDDVVITGGLTVQGTTTTVDTTNLEVKDKNIVVNNGGDDASSEGSGLTVERTGTDGSVIYATAATSKFKIGDVGSEVEVADISSSQAITNKQISSSTFIPYTDTYDNLVTYAALGTHDGELVLASDIDQYYKVTDSGLAGIAGGSGAGLDVFYTESFDVTDSGDFTEGVNATWLGTDGGGGTGASDETTAPITGTSSLKSTTIVANEYAALETLPFELKQKGNWVGVSFYTTYTGDDDDYNIVISDDNDSDAILASIPVKASTSPLRHTGSFYVPSNATTFSWGYHKQTTTAGTLLVDDFSLSTDPFIYKELDVGTEWTPYDVTIGVGTKSATPQLDQGYWRRVGDSLEIKYDYRHVAAGSAGAGVYTFSLPNGLVVDGTKMDISADPDSGVVGSATATTTARYTGHTFVYSSTTLAAAVGSDLVNVAQIGSGNVNLGNTNVEYSFQATGIPIVGWQAKSEHVVTPSSVPKTYDRSGVGEVSDTNWTTDSALLVPYLTGDGTWRLKFNINGSYSSPASAISLNISGVSVGPDYQSTITYQLDDNTTHTIHSYALGTFFASRLSANATNISMSGDVSLNSKPTWADPVSSQYLAAVPTAVVGCRYYRNTAQTLTDGTVMKYDVKVFDSHSAYNTTTGIYTFPETGKYRISAGFGANVNATVDQFLAMNIVVDSVAVCVDVTLGVGSSGTRVLSPNAGNTVDVVAGDTLQVDMGVAGITGSTIASQSYNYLAIDRIGD